MPQRSSHIGLFDAKSDCGVTAPVFIRSNETPMGRKLRYTYGPYCRYTATPPGQVPDSILFQMIFYFLNSTMSSSIVQISMKFGRKLCHSRRRNTTAAPPDMYHRARMTARVASAAPQHLKHHSRAGACSRPTLQMDSVRAASGKHWKNAASCDRM